MALYAIGDIQGCDAELGALLATLNFSAHRDRLWFVGDLVNRGPASLEVLRRVRALGDAATVTLGNHDLHLLAVAFGCSRLKSDDTLTPILQAPDRDALLQWHLPVARACARELEQALRSQPEKLFKHMYGDKPDRWDEALEGSERLRYIVNCFTRLRYVDEKSRLELHAKGSPRKAERA